MKLRTWHVEIAAAALVLHGVALAQGGWLAQLAALAVTLTFAHAQVASRLAERDAARTRPAVECHAWQWRYLAAKELAWVAYFALTGAWPCLAGCALLLLYAPWRKLWRSQYPIADVRPAALRRVVSVTVTRPVAAGQIVTLDMLARAEKSEHDQ